jgi:NAD+ diphosphatase
MLGVRLNPFSRLVKGLKEHGKTCTVVESCCGGLINSSIMAVPGSSAVYYGGSVAYNTKRAKKLLLDDSDLHGKLVQPIVPEAGESEGDAYVRSKMNWTAQTALAFCEQMDVDYAIAEGGASGPTFRPKGLDKGFAVIAIAGRDGNGTAQLLAQATIRSDHADRQLNMRLFADAAAKFAADTIGIQSEAEPEIESEDIWLDRATHLRSDEIALKELENRPDAKHVVLRDSKECLFSSNTKLSLLTTVSASFPKTFLGLEPSGTPIFAIDVDETNQDSLEIPSGSYFDNTRTHAPLLHKYDHELAFYATAFSNWKRTHKYCSECGATLMPIQGGTCLQCMGCKSHSWARQDPSIIVLVTNRQGDKALLARSARHPRKVHTAVAGFVEAGETFEKAVMREVFEETGARVDEDSITYLASQPWPFPRSSMIGFRATADDTLPLTIDTNELLSASWFDRSLVGAAARVPGAVMNKDVAEKAIEQDPSLQVLIPPTGVLARSLIDNWLEDA